MALTVGYPLEGEARGPDRGPQKVAECPVSPTCTVHYEQAGVVRRHLGTAESDPLTRETHMYRQVRAGEGGDRGREGLFGCRHSCLETREPHVYRQVRAGERAEQGLEVHLGIAVAKM